MTMATLAKPVTLVRHNVYCYHRGCGKVLFEAAGQGDVVVFKKCRFCKTVNIVDFRVTEF